MAIRNRSLTRPREGLRRDGRTRPYYPLSRFDLTKSIEDVTESYGNENPMILISRAVEGSILNGIIDDSIIPSYIDCPSYFSRRYLNYAWPDFEGDAASAKLNALAHCNPSRPDVLLPVFIAELKDIPRMVKYGAEVGKYLSSRFPSLVGKGINSPKLSDRPNLNMNWLDTVVAPSVGSTLSKSKQLAIANLSVQFGALPFLSDLAKMVGFTEAVNRRHNEIDRLYSGSGLKRRWKSNVLGTSGTFSEYTNDNPIMAAYDMVWLREARRWATIRYRPTERSPSTPPSDDDIRQMMLGLNLNSIGSIAWEVIPWSWLSDYFGTIGKHLQANNNHLQTSYTGSLMSYRKVFWSHPADRIDFGELGAIELSPGKFTHELKEREPITPGILPSFGIPYLGAGQLSILTSITATRAFR